MKAFPCCTTPFVGPTGQVQGDILATSNLEISIEKDPQIALLRVLMHLSVHTSDAQPDKHPPIVDVLA